MSIEEDEEFERFAEAERRKLLNAQANKPIESGMTPLGSALFDFRSIPYPASKEREAEIESMHRAEQRQRAKEHRACLIAFTTECLAGKHGNEACETAQSVLRTVETQDMIESSAGAKPENCSNLILWDVRRRVSLAKARQHGHQVPERLKEREQCLAEYNARRISDETWDELQKQVANPKPQAPPQPAYEQGSFGHWTDNL